MIADTLEAIATELRGVGLSADLDPAKVNLPGVWVSVGSLAPEFLSGAGTVTVSLYLIAKDGLYPDVLTQLDTLLGSVLGLVNSEGDIVPESVVMPDSPQPLPSWRVTVLAPYE